MSLKPDRPGQLLPGNEGLEAAGIEFFARSKVAAAFWRRDRLSKSRVPPMIPEPAPGRLCLPGAGGTPKYADPDRRSSRLRVHHQLDLRTLPHPAARWQ